MRFKAVAAAVLLSVLMLTSIAIAGTNGTEPLYITDMKGREIYLETPATRIVALAASDCEILYALGAGDLLVGRGEYCDYPADVLEKPAVQSGNDMNIEQILALAPQVVVMNTMAQSLEQVAALENAGIAVVASESTDIDDIYEAIELLGALTGRNEDASVVADEMRGTLNELAHAMPEDGAKSIYFEVSPLEYGLWTAGSGTFMSELCVLMGTKNCFDDVQSWAEISEEQVLERNPDYIVTFTPYYGSGITPEEEITSRSGWSDISAVKNGKILRLDGNELTRPSPRLTEGALRLYEFVYAD